MRRGFLYHCAQILVFLSLFIWTPEPGFAGFILDGAPICVAGGNQENHVVVADGQGGAIVVWEDNRGYRDIYAQRITGLGEPLWALDGIGVCTFDYGQYAVHACPDGDGGAFIVWQDGRPHPNRDIYAQHVAGDGQALWTVNGVAVCAAGGDQFAPKVCPDGAGGCIVAWYDGRTSSQYDIYAQRITAAGAAAWIADGVAICTATGTQNAVQIEADDRGGAYLAWVDYRSSGDIYAQRVRADGTVAWATDGIAVCAAANIQEAVRIAADGCGGLLVAWSDRRAFYDIYAQRADSLGAMLWTAGGVGLCVHAEWQNYPVLAPDGTGGAVVAWLDQRANDYDCFAQKINGAGSVQWTANGVPVCSASGGCTGIQIASDGAGGAVATWSDSRNVHNDIFVQRIDATGAPVGTLDGDSLCTQPDNQNVPWLCSDGDGGGIVCWMDYRNGSNYDLYAARYRHDGQLVATLLRGHSVRWTRAGVAVAWSLADPAPELTFAVLRAGGAAVDFREIFAGPLANGPDGFAYCDDGARPGQTHVYRVDLLDAQGRWTLFDTQAIAIPAMPPVLRQNHPNPFNPSTTIVFDLPERVAARLTIHDAAGRLVHVLAEGTLEPGIHSRRWDGTDRGGVPVAAWVYYYRLAAGGTAQTRALSLVR